MRRGDVPLPRHPRELEGHEVVVWRGLHPVKARLSCVLRLILMLRLRRNSRHRWRDTLVPSGVAHNCRLSRCRGNRPRALLVLILVVVRPGSVELRLGFFSGFRLGPRWCRWRSIVITAAHTAALVDVASHSLRHRANATGLAVVRVRVGGETRVAVFFVLVGTTRRRRGGGRLLALTLARRLAAFAEPLGERVVVDLQLRYVLILKVEEPELLLGCYL